MSNEQGGQGGQGNTSQGGGAGAGDAGAGSGGSGNNTGANGAGGQGTGGTAPAWHGLTEAADVAYVQTKGWKAAPDIYKSYRGVETLIGRDPSTLLAIPRADDPAGQRAVFARLGMPESADKYDIVAPEGANDAYKSWVKETFHKAGLTAAQAKALSTANTEYVKTQADEAVKAYERAVQTDKATLLSEWRGGYERQMNAAQTAVKALGFTADMIDAMEETQGYAATMKFFAAIGQKLGEDSFVSGTDKSGGGFGAQSTPAEAKVEWEKMKADPVQAVALRDNQHPGHEAAKLKQTQLFQIMFPQ